jgi:hypothetical protein
LAKIKLESAWDIIAEQYDVEVLKNNGFTPDMESDVPFLEQVEDFIYVGEIDGKF